MASLSITALSNFFSEERKSICKGENHYKSDHVESFFYNAGAIRGQVHASMKEKSYKVTIYLDEKNEIRSTEGECPKGAYKCSHAAALFIYGIHNLSRTDVECSWKKKKKADKTPDSVEEMFPSRRERYIPVSRMPSDEDRRALYSHLSAYGRFTGLWWIMTPEPPEPQPLPIPTINEIITSQEFLSVQGKENQIAYIQDKVKISNDAVETIATITRGQRTNPLWHHVRKGRLTASNFGSVLNAGRITPSLLKRLLGEYDLSRVKAVQWGVQNEAEAINHFRKCTGLPVAETGIWLDPNGVLGASPDGLIGQNHVLEVKCPYTQRNLTIAEAVLNDSFCLKRNHDGTYQLKQDQVYWHQVQGQLFLTRRHFCFFVVWTTKESTVLLIKRDETWAENIDILSEFYFAKLFQKIVEGEL